VRVTQLTLQLIRCLLTLQLVRCLLTLQLISCLLTLQLIIYTLFAMVSAGRQSWTGTIEPL
jgi:hypothetical protein